MHARWLVYETICLLLAIPSGVRAADGAGAESPLARSTDARVLSMGGLATVLGDGPESTAQNPALLGWLCRGVLSFHHTDLYSSDTSLQSGFAAYPTLELGTFTLGIQRLGVGGIDARDERNLALGEFDVREVHASLGYAKIVSPWLSLGLNLRLVQQSVDQTSATAAGLDVGLATRRPISDRDQSLELGVALQNAIAPRLRLDEEEVSDPLRTRVGVAHRWMPSDRRLHTAFGLDASFSPEADMTWGVGTEIGFDGTFFLRAGLNTGHPTAGLGVRARGLEFAYAFLTDDELPRDDRFTIGWRFGASVDDRREARLERQERELTDLLTTLLQSREDEAIAQVRREAEAAWAAQDFDRTELLYGRLLLLDPENDVATQRVDEARRRRALAGAEAELTAGSAANAATQYQRVLDRWPDDAIAAQGLERARQRMQRDEDRRGQVRVLFSDALGRFTEGDVLGARAALDELLRLDPEHEDAREFRGRVERNRRARLDDLVAQADRAATEGNQDRAIAVLRRAVVLDPERRSEFESRIAEWQAEQARRRRELAAAQKAPAAATAEGATTAPLARPSESRRAELSAWFEEGLRDFEAGQYERATTSWRRVWEVDPQHGDVGGHLVRAHLLLGIQSYTAGDYDRALDQCRRALEIDPQNQKAQRYVARIEEERASVRAIDQWRADR